MPQYADMCVCAQLMNCGAFQRVDEAFERLPPVLITVYDMAADATLGAAKRDGSDALSEGLKGLALNLDVFPVR